MRRVVCSLLIAVLCSACGESRESPGTTPTPVPSAPGVSITQISVAQGSLAGGQPTEGTVTLSGAAPSGVIVTLSSSHPTVVVPSSLSVAAGAASASFPIATQAVTAMTEVSITATLGSSTQSTTLRVNVPGPRIVNLTVDPSVAGGTTSSASVEMDRAAPEGGVAVALSSDNPAARVPATVTVPAGATRATFVIPTQGGSAKVRATITATLNGDSRSATIVIRALGMRLLSVPASVIGGTTVSGSVQIDGVAPSGGVTVTLESNTSVAQVPRSVTVPAGSSSATFSISTAPVTGSGYAYFIARLGDSFFAAAMEITLPDNQSQRRLRRWAGDVSVARYGFTFWV